MDIKTENIYFKQETGQDGLENEVNTQRLLPRMPPLIPLPRPGYWLAQTNAGTNTEHSDGPMQFKSVYLKCSSCLAFVHSTLVLSCDIGHLLCFPCWLVMAMAQDHFPLSREQLFRMELTKDGADLRHQGEPRGTCGCGMRVYNNVNTVNN